MSRLGALIVVLALSGRAIADTCHNRCGNFDPSRSCQCNSHCVANSDCCNDYHSLCTDATCSGRCGSSVDHSKPCQCNSACSQFGDCCGDYHHLCSSGPPTEAELTTIANTLWIHDVNRATHSQVMINPQTKVSQSNREDKAPLPLFSHVSESSLFSKPTYSHFISLMNNYDHDIGNIEHISSAQWAEVNQFLDAILATRVMTETETFLRNKGLVTGGSSAFRDMLFKVWFELYKRTSSGKVSSSGFEHVFVGETQSSSVSGFHNWVQFHLEEKTHRLEYKGYVSQSEPDIIGSQFTWHGNRWKTKGTFFVGTSPEFEMALYTICFWSKPDSVCRFTLNGHSVGIQTYDNANWSGKQIASAYAL